MPAAAAQVNPSHRPPVPPAVRRQIEAAEAAQKSFIEGPAPPQVANQPAPPPQPAPQPEPQPQPAPQFQPAPQPAPQPIANPSEVETERGRTKAAQERADGLQAQLTQSNGMIADLQRSMRALEDRLNTAPAAAPARLITPEEEADFGAPMLDIIGRRAQEMLGPQLADLKAENARLAAQINGVREDTGRARGMSIAQYLTSKMPDWERLNHDPAFLAWLKLPAAFSTTPRGEYLGQAYNLNNAEGVLNVFQGYLNEAAGPSQTGGTPPSPDGKVPLESFAAPGRASQAASGDTAPAGKVAYYKRSGIAAFNTAKTKGEWRGREAEAAAIDADIILAGVEGRILNG